MSHGHMQVEEEEVTASDALDVADAIEREIKIVWGVIAALQWILTEHGGEPHINGALRLANNHLDALSAIRRDAK